MLCPACNKPLGALTATPHCANKACTWTKCHCGATIDRNTGTGYEVGTFYPAE